MRPHMLLPALIGLLALASCSPTGQQQAAAGTIQLPGERPAPDVGLNVPPNVWAGPGQSDRGQSDRGQSDRGQSGTPSFAPTR